MQVMPYAKLWKKPHPYCDLFSEPGEGGILMLGWYACSLKKLVKRVRFPAAQYVKHIAVGVYIYVFFLKGYIFRKDAQLYVYMYIGIIHIYSNSYKYTVSSIDLAKLLVEKRLWLNI